MVLNRKLQQQLVGFENYVTRKYFLLNYKPYFLVKEFIFLRKNNFHFSDFLSDECRVLPLHCFALK